MMRSKGGRLLRLQWIKVDNRNPYMDALEEASVRQNIGPFAEFLSAAVEGAMRE